MERLLKYWHTIRYLKPKQIGYRLYYKLRGMLWPSGRETLPAVKLKVNTFNLHNPIESNSSYITANRFRFLNIEHEFQGQIDWNFDKHGKLWTYNLNYFDFLHQAAFLPEMGVQVMTVFADSYAQLKDGKEPYPTSLRIMNWVSFVSRHHVSNEKIDEVIYQDVHRLNKNIEYHLMGNHLLENAFGLLFGALYLGEERLYLKSRTILTDQLEEQVLSDGAHFELSPMYHQIILSRLLASIDLLRQNDIFEAADLLALMMSKAEAMLSWLSAMSFQNGSLPAVNDSTEGIAPAAETIFEQAKLLGIEQSQISLNASGYRKRQTPAYELLADVGNIGPDYIPGHAHSDTLNFLLNVRNQPVVVDTGISTYEKNALRNAQRATAAHNTVMVNGQEQTAVWGGFRVARRAKATLVEDSPSRLVASHDGYRNLGIIHQRSYDFTEAHIDIKDSLTKSADGQAFLHFHPDVKLDLIDNQLKTDYAAFSFEGATSVKLESYQFAKGFNLTCPAQKAVIYFSNQITTHIHIL